MPTANTIGYYPRGEPVSLTLWATSARGQVDLMPVKQPFRYADDSRTGIYDIDSQHVYCDFDLLQKLLEMRRRRAWTARARSSAWRSGPLRADPDQAGAAVDDLSLKAPTTRLGDAYHGYADDPRFAASTTTTASELIASMR